jgi:hypothetical protein
LATAENRVFLDIGKNFFTGDQLSFALLNLRHATFRLLCLKAIDFLIEWKVEE